MREILYRQARMIVDNGDLQQVRNRTLSSPNMSDELVTLVFCNCHSPDPKKKPEPPVMGKRVWEIERKYMDDLKGMMNSQQIMSTPLAIVVQMYLQMAEMVITMKPIKGAAHHLGKVY